MFTVPFPLKLWGNKGCAIKGMFASWNLTWKLGCLVALLPGPGPYQTGQGQEVNQRNVGVQGLLDVPEIL